MTDAAGEPKEQLTHTQEEFAQAVVRWYGNQSRAWRELHPDSNASDKAVWEQASRMASISKVAARISELTEAQRVPASVAAHAIIEKARRIVEADPASLIRTHVGCCRHCWGEGHRYQFTTREYENAWQKYARDLAAADKRSEPAPEMFEDGGAGFDMKREPNADCPECGGRGVTQTHIVDTRKLSPEAALLYAGVKRTKHGLEIVMQDQSAWAEKILKAAGAYVDRREVSGPGGGPIPTANVTVSTEASAQEVAAAYADMVKGAP